MSYPTIFDFGWYVREFFGTGNDSVADGSLGLYGWELDTIGNASTLTRTADDGIAWLRLTTAATADGDGESISLDDDTISIGANGGFLAFRCRYPNITGNQLAGNNFRVGLTDVRTSSEPAVGIWVDSNAGVVELDVASANGDLNVAADNPDLTSNTTLVLGTTYDIEVRWSGENSNSDPGPQTVQLWINGYLSAEIDNVLLDAAETMEVSVTHWQDSGGAADLEFDIASLEAGSYVSK